MQGMYIEDFNDHFLLTNCSKKLPVFESVYVLGEVAYYISFFLFTLLLYLLKLCFSL